MSCRHPNPKLCQFLGQHITGRLWEIWSGQYAANPLPESKRQQYIRRWIDAAGLTPEEIAPFLSAAAAGKYRRDRCRHLGASVRTEVCPACAGNVSLKVFHCSQHGECTVAKPLDGVPCCANCPDHDPFE